MKPDTVLNTKNKRFALLILAVLLLSAVLLRVYNIGAHGIAGDEKYAMYVSQFVVIEGGKEANAIKDAKYFTPKEFWEDVKTHHFYESIARLDTGNGAFYTLSLRGWMQIFGKSDAAARSLSVMFNLLTILLLYVFVTEFFGNRNLALLVVFLSAVSPFYIAFSQVARNYAMLFFFALAATYLLLRIIRKFQTEKRFYLELMLYSICALICLLCHISTAVLFVVHGIFILIFFREKKIVFSLLGSAVVPVMGMVAWLSSEGGKYMFEYVANSVKTYNYYAQNSPEEFLKVATPMNVFNQMQYVISCLFISAEGLYRELIGVKNALIAFVAALGLIITHAFVAKERLQLYISIGILIISYALFSVAKWQFLILSTNFFLLYLLFKLVKQGTYRTTEKVLELILLSISLGIVFLVIFAFRDGNTFRLMPRYVGYIYSFSILLVSLVGYHIYQNFGLKLSWLLIPGVVQLFLIFTLIKDIYRDDPPRYFMQFYEPRQVNPYQKIADLVIQKAAPSDTIIYPSFSPQLYGGKDETNFPIADAQLINIYLPDNSEAIQRIDRNEPDKVILKHADGSQEILFDFEGTKYRY